jgi:cob(I)alamin adenosyltransferase
MTSGEGFGKVHVITGPGKGKTTAAFGLAMRVAGHGYRVCVVQFMKTGETTGESVAAKHIGSIEVVQFGSGRFVVQGKPTEADVKAARAALDAVRTRLAGGLYQMMVLDEVNVAVWMGLIKVDEVLGVLKSRPTGTEIVLTGRNAPEEFVEYADYVSVIENAKHPYSNGTGARKGVEW